MNLSASAHDPLGAISRNVAAQHRTILKGGPYPQYSWDSPEEIPENSRKTPETLSERFLEFPSTVRLGYPTPYNSRHLRLPKHSQNSLPLSTAGDASFFRSGSREGLSELVMEFPAVLRVYLLKGEDLNGGTTFACRSE